MSTSSVVAKSHMVIIGEVPFGFWSETFVSDLVPHSYVVNSHQSDFDGRVEMEKDKAREYMRGVRERPGIKEYLRVYQAKIRAERKAAGLCSRCGKTPPREGFQACGPCAQKQTDNLTRARRAKPTREQCMRCESQRVPGKRLCEPCAVKAQTDGKRKYYARHAENRKRALAAGMCSSCLCKPPVSDRRFCADCLLRRRLKNYPGLTKEEFLALPKICAICGSEDEDDLNIDHDHSSGNVRDMLCSSCNFGVGFFKDNPELLRKAIAYLDSHKAVQPTLSPAETGASLLTEGKESHAIS